MEKGIALTEGLSLTLLEKTANAASKNYAYAQKSQQLILWGVLIFIALTISRMRRIDIA